MMSGIRTKNTKPELLVRRYLHSKGLRYRLHRRDLPGRPDVVLPRYRSVVFVHGCFWHQHPGCRFAVLPKSNRQFWLDKFRSNRQRDERDREALEALGWTVFVIWECETNEEHLEQLVRSITARDRWPTRN